MLYSQITDDKQYIKSKIFEHIDSDSTKVFLFGSRVKNTHKPYSDWDIGILSNEKIPFIEMMRLKTIFDETPFSVDIIDFNAVEPRFKEIVFSQAIEYWN